MEATSFNKNGRKYFAVIVCQNTTNEYGMADLIKNRLKEIVIDESYEDREVICDYYENSVDGVCLVWYYADTNLHSPYSESNYAKAEIHGFIYDALQYVNPLARIEDRVIVRVFKHSDDLKAMNEVLNLIKKDIVFKKDLQAAKYLENIHNNINEMVAFNNTLDNKPNEVKNDDNIRMLELRREDLIVEIERCENSLKGLKENLKNINKELGLDEPEIEEVTKEEAKVQEVEETINIPEEPKQDTTEINPEYKEVSDVVKPKRVSRSEETPVDVANGILNVVDTLMPELNNDTHTKEYREAVVTTPKPEEEVNTNIGVGTESDTTTEVAETKPEENKEVVETPVDNKVNTEVVSADEIKPMPEFKEERLIAKKETVIEKPVEVKPEIGDNNGSVIHYTMNDAKAIVEKVIREDEDFIDWDQEEADLFQLFLQNKSNVENNYKPEEVKMIFEYATTRFLGEERSGEELPQGLVEIRSLKLAQY